VPPLAVLFAAMPMLLILRTIIGAGVTA